MRAAAFTGPRSIEVTDRPDPVVAPPTDVGRALAGKEALFMEAVGHFELSQDALEDGIDGPVRNAMVQCLIGDSE